MLTDESSLPRQILLDSVLSFLDLYSLIKFASASKKCKNIVFQEISKARWKEVNLCGNQSITDDQLSVLLQNINAKENTAVLSLVACLKIKGPGLQPLHGSNILEDIDLRVCGSLPLRGKSAKQYGPSGLMEECVARILCSMLPLQWDEANQEERESWKRGWVEEGCRPMALRRVAIRPQRQHPNLGSSRFLGFFKQYECLKRFQDFFQKLPNDINYDPKVCSLCFTRILKSEDELFCTACNSCFCNDCAMPPACLECTNQRCQWCSYMVKCSGCNQQRCGSHAYAYECCGACDKIFCQDCHEDELEFSIVHNEPYCTVGCYESAH